MVNRYVLLCVFFFFFKQKTAYEMRISDWSSDVCSSDLYIASLMVAKLEAGVGVSQDFYFTAHDLFRVTGVNGSARSYARLSDELERLQGTQIKNNIEAGGEGQAGVFSWLSESQLHYTKTKTGDKRLHAVEVGAGASVKGTVCCHRRGYDITS